MVKVFFCCTSVLRNTGWLFPGRILFHFGSLLFPRIRDSSFRSETEVIEISSEM